MAWQSGIESSLPVWERFFRDGKTSLGLWWRRSRTRRQLLWLDDRQLRDIGIDRVTAMEEARKPFWRE